MNLCVIYIHGFASGSDSTKGKYFAKLADQNKLNYHSIDLTPTKEEFTDMTIPILLNRIDKVVKECIYPSSMLIIGSSMGGFLALHYLQQTDYDILGLFLLAPAIYMHTSFKNSFPSSQLERWKKQGTKKFKHYTYNDFLPLKYTFMESLEEYPTENINLNVPTTVIHGWGDKLIPYGDVVKYFANKTDNADISLHLFQSDHLLHNVFDEIEMLFTTFISKIDDLGE